MNETLTRDTARTRNECNGGRKKIHVKELMGDLVIASAIVVH